MKNILYILLLPLLFSECKHEIKSEKSDYFSSVTIDTLLLDTISIRAIIADNGKIWYAADKGRYGYYDIATKEKFQETISKDSINPEFRSIAKNSGSIFMMSVGTPGLLYKVAKDGSETKLVYKDDNEKTFFDSMQFWNDKDGIAIGDPTDSCFSVIITRDSGNTWHKIPCNKLPKIVSGEAAFAASNTNLVVKNNIAWIVSGGKKARIFYTSDKGDSWEVFNTPIVQGEAMTGIFSADFYDENIGFAVGGNYEKPELNSKNKALTINGGKTWTLIGENTGFGYASCVQFVPESGGKQIVTVGHSGLYYSSDNGSTWKQFSKDKDLYTIRFIDNHTAIAAGKNKIIKIQFKK
ncbi:oxidoreductase [Flavobacterium sp. WW92]|uniref:WD40/YVTN/BNR-like repeat-containing protein n=1 Tax=unclassified Flavobacterium TaxID=196869 RepID=UPI00222565B1|nr:MULTISPECIES: oxidoreductase [unclassified Flavobacterium]WDO12536.1 oxidoreductase [Flavobacterium sp. WW92]